MNIRESIKKYLDEFEYEKEASDAFLVALDKMLLYPEISDMLNRHINNYKEGKLVFSDLTADSVRASEISGIHKFTAAFLFYVAPIPYSLPYFEAVGLGREEWFDSMIDFRWKAVECYKVHGIWGTFVDWFEAFYTAERVAFGRLQFNPVESERDYKSDSFDIKKGDTLITVHIPSDSRTPFSKENRESAYKRAAKFFAPKFKNGEVIFRCGSWLLNPAHREILPERSNIRSFLDDFELADESFTERTTDVWRIFYVADYNGDPNTLPEETSLMRTYKAFLQGGGKMGSIVGYRKEKI